MLKFISNILLAFIALALATILFPVGLLVALIFLIFKFDVELTWKYFNRVFYSIAKSIDILGNYICSVLFNYTLIQRNTKAYRFGKENETISSALGKNVLANNLTVAGKCLNFILNLFEEDHAVKAIQ